MEKIKILIVEDHPMMRTALRVILEDESDLEPIGETKDGRHAVQLAAELDPDVILMDLMLPGIDGIEAIGRICNNNPESKILALTSLSTDEKVMGAVQAGALGYITKESSDETLIDAIHTVATGQPYLPPEIALKVLKGVRRMKHVPTIDEELRPNLTPRQEEILALMGEGRTDAEIAKLLFLKEGTVRFHIHSILQRLGFENRSQAAAYANLRDVNQDE